MSVAPEAPRIPASRLEERRSRVLEELGHGALVLHAGPLRIKSGDTEYRFRPWSDFQYLVGWGEPDAVLVLRAHADDDRFVLFVPPRAPAAELWTGTRLGVEGARSELGAHAAHPLDELEERLPALLEGADHVFARLGDATDLDRVLIGTLRRARARAGRTGGLPAGVLDPGLVLDELRLFKDGDELASIQHACDITVAGFRAAARRVGPERGEWEVQAALEGEFLALGAFGPAFGTIVGGGPRACTLHYTRNDHRMPAGGLVLVDAGAEYHGYAGDITRTFPVDDDVSPLPRRLHALVDDARRAAIEAIRPGRTIDEVEAAARSHLAAGLVELGLVRTGDEGERRERLSSLIPHKVSHWLGLDVHDVGAYRVHGAARVLEPGMVLTVEPGVYVQPDDTEAPEALRGVGVRIEDDVRVTPDGCENLTAALPTGLDALRALTTGRTA